MAQQNQQRGTMPPPREGARAGAQGGNNGHPNESGREHAARAYKEFKARITGDRFKADILSTMAPEHRKAGIFDRVRDSMLRAARDNHKLLTECDWPSFKRAAEEAARRGLIFGDNEAWAIPYKGQVQFQLGWRGMIMLAMRSGIISRVSSQAVYENDRCTILLGSDPKVEHEIPVYGERGPLVGVYAIATYKDSMAPEIEFMGREEIDRIRAGSPGKNSPAWQNHYDEMGRAKVVKRLAKRLPQQNPELFRDDDDGPLIEGEVDLEEVDNFANQPAQLEHKPEVPFDVNTGEVRDPEPVQQIARPAARQQRRPAPPTIDASEAAPPTGQPPREPMPDAAARDSQADLRDYADDGSGDGPGEHDTGDLYGND